MKKYFTVYIAALLLQALVIIAQYFFNQRHSMPSALYATLSFLLLLGSLVTFSGIFVSIYLIWRYLEKDSLVWFLGVFFAPIFVIPIFLYRAAYQKSPFENCLATGAQTTVRAN